MRTAKGSLNWSPILYRTEAMFQPKHSENGWTNFRNSIKAVDIFSAAIATFSTHLRRLNSYSVVHGKSGGASSTSALRPGTARLPPVRAERSRTLSLLLLADFVAKVENRMPRKSRESRFLGISIGARILGADAKVRGRFYVKRYGPSRREARDASAPLRISVHHPNNTFATKSALFGPEGSGRRCQPLGAKRT
jgi:hypothetical protein